MLPLACLFVPSPARSDEVLCQGPFASDTDHARLVAAFGSVNVGRETIRGPEGTTFRASVVYPKDPARRLEVIWFDEKARRRPSTVWIVGTAWAAPNGLRAGSSLAEAQAANGRAFMLYGFEWDYGGTVSDWRGGALQELPGGCGLTVLFAPDEAAGDDALAKVAGDRTFTSDSPAMKAARPTIRTIGLRYRR